MQKTNPNELWGKVYEVKTFIQYKDRKTHPEWCYPDKHASVMIVVQSTIEDVSNVEVEGHFRKVQADNLKYLESVANVTIEEIKFLYDGPIAIIRKRNP